jgi:hypothetical protein
MKRRHLLALPVLFVALACNASNHPSAYPYPECAEVVDFISRSDPDPDAKLHSWGRRRESEGILYIDANVLRKNKYGVVRIQAFTFIFNTPQSGLDTKTVNRSLNHDENAFYRAR